MRDGDEATVRATYEAFNADDLDRWVEYFTHDVELHELPSIPDAEVYRGHEGMREYARRVQAIGRLQFDAESIEPVGERFVVWTRARAAGRGSGIELDMAVFHVIEMEGGLIRSLRGFESEAEARAAAADSAP